MAKYKEGSIFQKCMAEDYIKEIYYDKTGEVFYIKKLTVGEYESINKAMLRREAKIKDGRYDEIDTADLIIVTIIAGLVDAEGRNLLDNYDYDKVKDFDNELSTLLYKEIIELNNPIFEEVKKNIL